MRLPLFYLALVRFLPFLLVLLVAVLLMVWQNPFTPLVPWCLVTTTLFFLMLVQAPYLPASKHMVFVFFSFMSTMIAIMYLLQEGHLLAVAGLFAMWFLLLNLHVYREAFVRSAIFVSLSIVTMAAMMFSPQLIMLYTGCMAVGFLLAYLLMSIRYIFCVKIELRLRLYCYLVYLETLLVVLFDCYLQPDYPLKRYLYEKRIYDAKNIVLLTAQGIDLLVAHYPFRGEVPHDLAKHKACCDQLFLHLIASGQLRHRVADHTTFRFCSDEMRQLKQFLLQGFSRTKQSLLSSRVEGGFLDPMLSLDAMEGIYEMVLQVIAKEPISFLVFIQDMRAVSRLLMINQESCDDMARS